MRGMISPFVIVALISITTFAYFEFLKMKSLEENVKNEVKLDVKYHEKKLNGLRRIAMFKHKIYMCSHYYNCSNLTEFLANVSHCAGVNIYFDGNFYSIYKGRILYLNSRYMGC